MWSIVDILTFFPICSFLILQNKPFWYQKWTQNLHFEWNLWKLKISYRIEYQLSFRLLVLSLQFQQLLLLPWLLFLLLPLLVLYRFWLVFGLHGSEKFKIISAFINKKIHELHEFLELNFRPEGFGIRMGIVCICQTVELTNDVYQNINEKFEARNYKDSNISRGRSKFQIRTEENFFYGLYNIHCSGTLVF